MKYPFGIVLTTRRTEGLSPKARRSGVLFVVRQGGPTGETENGKPNIQSPSLETFQNSRAVLNLNIH